MSWITLTETDVKNHVTGAEYTMISTKALSSGQSNPVPTILADVTKEVRGYVAVRHQLDAGVDTLPDECKTAALDLTVARLLRRVPGGVLDPKGDRAKAEERATQFLRDVAAGKIALVATTTPSSSQASVAGVTHGVPTRTTKREHLDGL
jgi:hypothetical protein